MKKSIFLILLIWANLSCSNDKITRPRQIPKQVIGIVKSMDTLSFDDFLTKYISLEHYKNLAKDPKFYIKDNSFREEILLVSDYQWNNIRQREYQRFKDIYNSDDVIWKDTEFVDFEYKENNNYGIKWIDGTIWLKYNNKKFEIWSCYIYDGIEYHIFGLKVKEI